MRRISGKEARVLQTLLAWVPGPEVARIRAAGVARSTFWAARRRALREGWLTERYVPHPGPLGIHRIVVELGRPFVESRDEAVRAWRERAGTVLLWRFRDLVLSVVWQGPDGASLGTKEGDRVSPAPHLFDQVWTVAVAAPFDGIPVYFDYEGAWVRWSGSGNAISYPIPVAPQGGPGPDGVTPRIPAKDRRAAMQMLTSSLSDPERPEAAAPGRAEPGTAIEPPAWAPSWIRRRGFIDFARIPPMDGRRVGQVIFVTGVLREAGRPRDLLERLFRDSEVTPFLVAYDSTRLLLTLLAPRPPGAETGRAPVSRILNEHLQELHVERDAIATLVPVVDHQYDALLRGPGPEEEPMVRAPGAS